MRLGGPVFEKYADPAAWAAAVRAKGYRAAYCPAGLDADEPTVRGYHEAARSADVVIAEVGAWSNPLSPDEEERRKALDKCRRALDLAERIGACCAVNISGSRGPKWDGPEPRDLTDETFQMIVECVRGIVDAVKPKHACYTLETMPWMYPDSVESYERLLKAIDRPAAAVHFDPVNLVNCPERYFRNGELIKHFVARLGPRIKSCHFKDIILQPQLTVRLHETRPGTGGLDYLTLLKTLDTLSPDLPVMLEHLPREEYDPAARHVREQARAAGVGV